MIPDVYSCLSSANFCVCSFYNGVGDVNVDAIKKILADNKQVKPMCSSREEVLRFSSTQTAFRFSRRRALSVGTDNAGTQISR